MKKERKVKRYIRTTTFAQRKLMVEIYLKTHNISESCKRAELSRNTFRRWYPRYLKQGIKGIREPKKHIRKNLGRVPEKYACRVIELKKKNPNWGRRTIASIIIKENNNKKVISPGGVQKVLVRAGLWGKNENKQIFKI
ncbi:MAG: helix-turn-helix domain-containing protein [Candidatus Atribacteria bacterium]|nr:helix-turn-helix domain-containing protein [Candidatus Atribacteria bacterium]